jgi:hypothetical protein
MNKIIFMKESGVTAFTLSAANVRNKTGDGKE